MVVFWRGRDGYIQRRIVSKPIFSRHLREGLNGGFGLERSVQGFLSGVGQNIAAAICISVIGSLCLALGLTQKGEVGGLGEWPTWVASAGLVLLLAAVGMSVRILLRWRARRQVRRASGDRLAVLVTCLVGDSNDSMRESLREGLKAELDDAIEVSLWPERLELRHGRDADIETASARRARAWLNATNCDLMISGRVRADGGAVLRFWTLDPGNGEQVLAVAEPALDLPKDISEKLRAVLATRVLLEAAPAFSDARCLLPQMRQVEPRLRRLLEASVPPDMSLFLHHRSVLSAIGRQSGDASLTRRVTQDLIDVLRNDHGALDRRLLGQVRFNLAAELMNLGETHLSNELLLSAVEVLRPALGATAADTFAIQLNLGIALGMVGSRLDNAEVLNESIALFDRLIVEPGPADPILLGKALHNRGNALSDLADATEDESCLDLAAASFEAALIHRTPKVAPIFWARTHTSLAVLLAKLGRCRRNREYLDDALDHYRLALEMYVAHVMDNDCALVRYNMAVCLSALAAQTGDLSKIFQAIDQLNAAEAVWTLQGHSRGVFNVKNVLGGAYDLLAVATEDVEMAALAAESFEAALDLVESEYGSVEWSGVAMNLASARINVVELGGDPAGLLPAIALLEEVEASSQTQADHRIRALVKRQLGEAHLLLSSQDDPIPHLEIAVVAFTAYVAFWPTGQAHVIRANGLMRLAAAQFQLGGHPAHSGMLAESARSYSMAADVLRQAQANGHDVGEFLAMAEQMSATVCDHDAAEGH